MIDTLFVCNIEKPAEISASLYAFYPLLSKIFKSTLFSETSDGLQNQGPSNFKNCFHSHCASSRFLSIGPPVFIAPFARPCKHPLLNATFLDLFKSAPIKIYSYFFSAVFLLFLSGKHTLCKFTSLFDSLLADFAFLYFPLFTNKWPRFIKFYCFSLMKFLRLI